MPSGHGPQGETEVEVIVPLKPQLPPGPYSKWERRGVFLIATIQFATGLILIAAGLKGCLR